VRAVGRTLAGAQHLSNFFTLFLVLTLSALPLLTYTTTGKCNVAHTPLWHAAQASGKERACVLLMWDLFFASLFVGGTVRGVAPRARSIVSVCSDDAAHHAQVTALQVARRLETALLVQLLSGADARARDAEKGTAAAPSSPRIRGRSAAPARASDHAGPRGAARPATRRAAGLMAAPQAPVIRTAREDALLYTNALFEGRGDAPATRELLGVLINTGPPPQLRAVRAAASAALAAAAVPKPPLVRKLTQ
jgi:hypothetical protein